MDVIAVTRTGSGTDNVSGFTTGLLRGDTAPFASAVPLPAATRLPTGTPFSGAER